MAYQYLEHKADLLIEAVGKDYTEALESAAKGMFEAISRAKGTETLEVSVEAEDLEDLVVRTLSTLLSESEAEETPLSKLEIKEFERTPKPRIRAVAYGEKGAPLKSTVKAVTYHELSVKEEKEKTTIRVLLDI